MKRLRLFGSLPVLTIAWGCGTGMNGSDLQTDSDIRETAVSCVNHPSTLIPGPCEEGYDPDLDAKARRYDRCWTLFNAAGIGLNTDVGISVDKTADRKVIEDFIRKHDGWHEEFETFAERPSTDLLTSQSKVAGLYAGVGLVADAYRYGIHRDQGYPATEVERARNQLLKGLEALHIAVAITGVKGVIARGLGRKSWPGWAGFQTLPLFDESGNPQPTVKSNGEWRADNSPGGLYPDYVWEDSVSRDQLIGWAAAFGAAWEVIADDGAIPPGIKDTLQGDARDLGRALMKVGESGYDLEVPDADGRITLHGWLNEHNLDGQTYHESIENGFHAIMALGIVSSYAYCAQDPVLDEWLQDDLIGKRELARIVEEGVHVLTDFGYGSNYSNYNMAYMGFWLALRYIDDDGTRSTLRNSLQTSLYERPEKGFSTAEIHYSFYDFTVAAGMADANARGGKTGIPDAQALANGLDTLSLFREPPYWNVEVMNCPMLEQFQCKQQYSDNNSCTWDDSLLQEPCLAIDGKTEFKPIGCNAWKCTEAVADPVPWELQRPSNYHWRSAPNEPNGGGDGSALLPGVDFRFAYWAGRWTRIDG